MSFFVTAIVGLCALVLASSEPTVLEVKYRPDTAALPRSYRTSSNDVTIDSKIGGGYWTTITIGTSTMEVLLDTGSSNLAVASKTFGLFPEDRIYDASTGTNTGQSISVNYDSGTWSGTVYENSVQLGGHSLSSVKFAVITSQSHFFSHYYPYSGILGLAYRQIAQNNINPLLGYLGISLFSLQLCRGDGTSTGHLVLGGTSSAFYTGSIQYTPLTPKLFSSPGYFTITVSSAKIGSTSVSGTFYPIVDSGTNGVELQQSIFNPMLDAINNALGTSLTTMSLYKGDVSRAPTMHFTIQTEGGGSMTLSVPPTSYFVNMGHGGLNLALANSGSGYPANNILGTPMINNYFSVFDMANNKVGFAPISGC